MSGRTLICLCALLWFFHLSAQTNIETLREFAEFTALWHKNISLNADSFAFDGKTGILSCYDADKKIFARGPAQFADERYVFHGLWRRYYPNGRVLGELNFENSRRHGRAVGFYTNGVRALTCSYSGGSLDGIRMRYDRNGRLLDEAHYKEGLQTFLRIVTMISPSFQKPETIPPKTQYDPENKTWIYREMKNSRVRIFSDGGVLLAEIQVRNIATENEIFHGVALFYHKNGRLKEKGMYVSGERDGDWQQYSENGEIEVSTRYVSGEAVKSLTHSTLP